MSSRKRTPRPEQEHQVLLSASYKASLWKWLNRTYRPQLKELLRQPGAEGAHAGAAKLQDLIRARFAEDGIRDAEDLYQLVIGVAAEEFWCEVLNDVNQE
jgi:hypothetical protein